MATRRTRKKERKRAERAVGTIPGVPSFQDGGGIFANAPGVSDLPTGVDFLDVPLSQRLANAARAGSQPAATQLGQQFPQQGLIEAGLIPTGTPGLFFDPETGRLIDINPPSTGAGGGAAYHPPVFRPGELELLQEQNDLERRQQDLSVQQQNLDRELRELESQRQFQIANRQLRLAEQTERRIAEIQRAQQALEVQRFGLEQRRHALEEESTRFGMQTSLAAQQGQLATAQGNLAARRGEFLSGLLANPRDFVQSQIALGGGQSFIQSLLGGEAIGGQSTGLIGATPTLGQGFANALAQINARPEEDLFRQASETLGQIPSQFGPAQQQEALARTNPGAVDAAIRQRIQSDPAFRQRFQQSMQANQASMRGAIQDRMRMDPNFARQFAQRAGIGGFKEGGRMVLNEPVVAIGLASGEPRFTAGEGFEPEVIDITPLQKFQEGGRVTFGGLQQTGTPQQPRTKTASALGATAARNLFSRRQTAQQGQQGQPRQAGGGGMTVNIGQGGAFNAAAPPPFPDARPTFGGFGDPIGERGAPPLGGDLIPTGGVIPAPDVPPRPPPLDLSSLTGPGDFFGATVTPPEAFQNVPTGLMALAQFLLGDDFGKTFPNRSELTPEMVDFIQRGMRQDPDFQRRFIRDVQEQRLREQSAFNRLPQTPGEAARLLSTFSPRQFFNLLPEQEELRQSLISGIGIDPRSNVQSILRQIPTAPNPGSVAFGNFRKGGRVTVAPYR